MHKNNFYVSFGIWIAILPFLGIPGTWKSALIFLSGIFLTLVALGPAILKKLQTRNKAKTKKKQEPSKPELKFSANNDTPKNDVTP